MPMKPSFTRSLAISGLLFSDVVLGFSSIGKTHMSLSAKKSSFLSAVKLKDRVAAPDDVAKFDPLGLSMEEEEENLAVSRNRALEGMAASSVIMVLLSEAANAEVTMPASLIKSSGSFDPNTFAPVCGASDSFYRFLQGTAEGVVGKENFSEYGPLIASGLLRIRLELCVVESFFNEAVGPFIKQNGLSWVLPLHETVETFLAGTVFSLATTFILVGSTKLLTVIITYADFFVGGPMRLFGGFFFDRARGKPVTLDVGVGPFKTRVIGPKDETSDEEKSDFDYSVDLSDKDAKDIGIIVVSGGVKAAGQAFKIVREVLDAVDLFVGKSLILWVTFYLLIKFIHFKIFPDFPPFG